MTGFDRMSLALQHKAPDRPPYDQSTRSSAIEIEAYQSLKEYLGMKGPSACFLRAHAQIERSVHNIMGIDTEGIRYMDESQYVQTEQGDTFYDAWSVPWHRTQGSHYYELAGNPLKTFSYDQILSMDWAPLVSDRCIAELKHQVDYQKNHYHDALFCDQIGAGIFERAWYLRGFEQFLVDLMIEQKEVHAFLEKITNHQIEGYARIIDAVGDAIFGVLITDDLATQDSLICSKELYREMIKPYQRKLIEYLRGRGMHVVFHSCGAVEPLIGDLLEIGVEILHPIQRSARGMDPYGLKQTYGKDLVLWGGGCDTDFLQKASMWEIVEEVKRSVDQLGADGGFVFTTTHCIQPGTPPENILAMAGAIKGERQREGHEIDWVWEQMEEQNVSFDRWDRDE